MAGWKHHETIEETQEILDMFIKEDKTFAIVSKKNNKVIGSLGVEKYGLEDKLTEFNGYFGREIGYVLSKDYWGKGIMPEAAGAVIDYLFNDLNFDFLICGYYDFNNQSKRVQEKCGFKPYRKLVMDTRLGTKEPGVLNLLINPNKNISLVFSHPETLIYK
jgi:ribosomal-protein-alanine N-acetyltransferase